MTVSPDRTCFTTATPREGKTGRRAGVEEASTGVDMVTLKGEFYRRLFINFVSCDNRRLDLAFLLDWRTDIRELIGFFCFFTTPKEPENWHFVFVLSK